MTSVEKFQAMLENKRMMSYLTCLVDFTRRRKQHMGKIEELISTYETVVKIADDYLKHGSNCKVEAEKRMAVSIIEDLKQLKSSLPTQKDKVVVPELPRHIIDYLKWCERNNKTLLEVFGGARFYNTDYAYWTEEEKRKIAVAYATGDYTVEKEQLYWIYDPIADQYLG